MGLQSGQMDVFKIIPTSSSVEQSRNIASVSCDQIDEKIKKKAKKKKSKKQKRKELVDTGDLASQVRRDEKAGLLSGQMIFSGKISTANDEEQSLKENKKKKKSK